MKSKLVALALFVSASFCTFDVLAQNPASIEKPAVSAATVAAPESVPQLKAADIPVVVDQPVEAPDFFVQVLEAVKSFGGFSWWMKISVICMLLVSSMRVSIFKPLWEKAGPVKVLLAPLFALIIGIASLVGADGGIERAALMAYLLAGGGAIILHQLLDAIKELPAVGPKYDAWIDLVKGFLGGKK